MPNNITNRITLAGNGQSIENCLRSIQMDKYGLYTIDFEKIIPMPESELGDWYRWRMKHWSTKWNAYGYDGGLYINPGEIVFYTAWSAPENVIKALSGQYPEIEFTHEWADEDIGHNVGRRIYLNGVLVEEYLPPADSVEAINYAAIIMDSDPCNWGLVLNADGTEYVSTEGVPKNPDPVMITATVQFMLTEEDIGDILSSAFEGGINYWADDVKFVGEPLGDCASEHLARGGALRIHDSEENVWLRPLNRVKFLDGFKRWYESGCDKYGAVKPPIVDLANIDAECADAIVQFSQFGDVLYG